jgi:hypothetical protein
VGLLTRHPLPAAICALAFALTAGFFVFARPQYRPPHQGATIRIPDGRPAQAAAGRAGWVWPDGLPGWAPGESYKGYPVSGMQAIEAGPAELAAAHFGLDAQNVRVLVSQHTFPGEAPLAVLAAPMLGATPTIVCLAAVLPSDTTTAWRCPGATKPYPDVARSPVLVAAEERRWSTSGGEIGFNLVGVARGDVDRVDLHVPHQSRFDDQTLYERGKTWGQFESALVLPPGAGAPELRIHARGIVQTLTVDVHPGQQRTFG